MPSLRDSCDLIVATVFTSPGHKRAALPSVTGVAGAVQICVDFKTLIPLDKFGVESYDVVTEDTRKSAASGVARGAVGAALLGPVGMLAGLL